MKQKITIYLFALALIASSCGNNNEKEVVGKWTIEDMLTEDTTQANSFETFMVAAALSGVEYVEFTADKQFNIYNSSSLVNSAPYAFSKEKDSIVVTQKGEKRAMAIAESVDGKLRLKSNDGTTLVFSKKE